MKRSDIYPPGSEEDAQNLTPHPKFCGLPILVWALLVIFAIAVVGLYSDIVGFYDFAEDIIEGEHEEHNGDGTKDGHGDKPDDGEDDKKSDDRKSGDHKSDGHKSDNGHD